MAKIKQKSKDTPAKITTGILMPALMNKFAVKFGSKSFSEEGQRALTMQIVSFKANYVAKTLCVKIQQAQLLGEMHELAFEIARPFSTNRDIYLLHMSGIDENPVAVMRYVNCECIDHDITYDYAASDVATHIFHFKFSSVMSDLAKMDQV